MARLDLERARNLLESAETLLSEGDYHGVAGLAYQAFESGVICLLEVKNGGDKRSHYERRERAKQLLKEYRKNIDVLWEIRNIDFYGNVSLGKDKREISLEEAKDGLNMVSEILDQIEELIEEE